MDIPKLEKGTAREALLKFNELCNLPITLFRELIYQLPCNKENRERDRRSTAKHEAGHALMFLLNDVPMTGYSIGKMRAETHAALSKLLTKHIVPEAGEIKAHHEDKMGFLNDNPKEAVLMLLAGASASSYDHEAWKYFRRSLSHSRRRDRWNDMGIPHIYVKERITTLIGDDFDEKKLTSAAADIVMEVAVQLASLFYEQPFCKTLEVIRNLFLEETPMNGDDTNKEIVKYLEDSGISRDDMATMEQQIQDFDVDALILKYFGKRKAN
jgi:hypothetical protein